MSKYSPLSDIFPLLSQTSFQPTINAVNQNMVLLQVKSFLLAISGLISETYNELTADYGNIDTCEVRVPSYYGDGMVFQHDAASAWGYSNCDPSEVMAEVIMVLGKLELDYK